MTKKASLHMVRRDGSVAIFRIDAPAVASTLTRKAKALAAPGSRPVSTLGVMDISRSLLERLISALDTSDLNFSRNEKGKWFVRAVLPGVPEVRVETTDTQVAGEHTCSACGGTGRYTQGYGICYRCKGKGKTSVADRRRNSRYEMHRRNRAEARAAAEGGA